MTHAKRCVANCCAEQGSVSSLRFTPSRDWSGSSLEVHPAPVLRAMGVPLRYPHSWQPCQEQSFDHRKQAGGAKHCFGLRILHYDASFVWSALAKAFSGCIRVACSSLPSEELVRGPDLFKDHRKSCLWDRCNRPSCLASDGLQWCRGSWCSQGRRHTFLLEFQCFCWCLSLSNVSSKTQTQSLW